MKGTRVYDGVSIILFIVISDQEVVLIKPRLLPGNKKHFRFDH